MIARNKKMYLLCIGIVLLTICGAILFMSNKNNDEEVQNSQRPKNEFLPIVEQIKSSIDVKDNNAERSIDLTNEALYGLMDILGNGEADKYSKDDIEMISPNIKVFIDGKFRLVSYVQNPDDFGRSSRGAWKILQCTKPNKCFMIDENTTLNISIFKAMEIKGIETAYIAGDNYETNSNKIYIYGYQLLGEKLKKFNAIGLSIIDTTVWGINENNG